MISHVKVPDVFILYIFRGLLEVLRCTLTKVFDNVVLPYSGMLEGISCAALFELHPCEQLRGQTPPTPFILK